MSFYFLKAGSKKTQGTRDMECQATENANVYSDSLWRAMFTSHASFM